jgi:hypothetical protein
MNLLPNKNNALRFAASYELIPAKTRVLRLAILTTN